MARFAYGLDKVLGRLKDRLLEFEHSHLLACFSLMLVRRGCPVSAVVLSCSESGGMVFERMGDSVHIRRAISTLVPEFFLESQRGGEDSQLFNPGYLFAVHDPSRFSVILNVGTRIRFEDGLLWRLQYFLIGVVAEFFGDEKFVEAMAFMFDGCNLTARECEVLTWSCRGKTYEEISIITGISKRTVKFHMANVMGKLDVSNLKQAVSKAVSSRIVEVW